MGDEPSLADQAEEYLLRLTKGEQTIQRLDELVSQALRELLELVEGDREAERTIAQALAGELRKLADRLDTLHDPDSGP
jgi:hypothetical protein